MTLLRVAVAALLISLLALSRPATALTLHQFVSACESAAVSCSEHPFLIAYVGGALDLIAVLDEETEYLGKVYCEPKDELFDVTAIIQYMEGLQIEYSDKNAMLVLIRYFEEHGGCQS